MLEVLPMRSPGSAVPITRFIHPDEKADYLEEVNRLTDQYKEAHRWQRVYVNRNGERAVHITDMGLASAWTYGELKIMSLWQDSVEYLREEANKMRFENALTQVLAEAAAESTLLDDWRRLQSEIWEQAHNRSHFGPRFNKQRNAFVRRKT